MNINKFIKEFIGQSIGSVAIGGTISIMIVGAVISALITTGFITDPAVLVLVALFTLIVAVGVMSQLSSFI
jgi:hypothetical protein